MPPTSSAGGWCLRLVAGHPVAALLLWFFTVGQAVAFIPAVASSYGSHLPEQLFTTASTWVGLLLPSLAITWLLHGRQAARALLRLTAVPGHVRWYVLCLVGIPLSSLTITSLTAGAPTEASGSEVVLALLVGFGAQSLLHLLTNNLWEELAWTGFVTARLQARDAPMTVALMTAPLFALQHSPLVLDAGAGGLLGPVHLFAFAVIGLVVAVGTRGRLGLDSSVRTARPVAGLRAGAGHGT